MPVNILFTFGNPVAIKKFFITTLGKSLDQVLHDDEGNLRLKKEDYRKFWAYACELRDLRRKGEDHIEIETVKKLLLK